MARKSVVELAQRQMERSLGYWLLRMCKLGTEHGGWDHTQLEFLVCTITNHRDKVSTGPCLQLCWRRHISSVAQFRMAANAGQAVPALQGV